MQQHCSRVRKIEKLQIMHEFTLYDTVTPNMRYVNLRLSEDRWVLRWVPRWVPRRVQHWMICFGGTNNARVPRMQ
jgi:hypothetical protein